MRDIASGQDRLRILVAGGAGFIGSHLCEALLDRDHEVVCLDSFLTGSHDNIAHLAADERFSLIEQDVCEKTGPHRSFDRIFNLACPASPKHYQADPIHTMMTSVVGTNNLLQLAARHGARFVQASTSEVYGDPEQHPQPESYLGQVNCTGPRACYDEGKRAAEALCFDMRRLGSVDVRVARIFNTYGPRMQQNDGRIVSNLIVQALSDRPLTIYGTGRQTRSFCYVSDLVAGLLSLMEVEVAPDTAVNLGNPDEIEILELARLIQSHLGAAPVAFEPLPVDDPRRRRPDISLANRLLGWTPGVGLDEGLGKTIQHFQNETGTPRPVPRDRGQVATAAAVQR